MSDEFRGEYSGEPEIGDTDTPEKMPSPFQGRRPRNEISYQRRIRLQELAVETAGYVMENIKPHERCLFRRMVENLLPGED